MNITKLTGRLLIIWWFVFFLSSVSLSAQSGPVTNQGKKWRIGYYEGGPFSDYTDTMRTLVVALAEMGWINDGTIPRLEGDISLPYLKWLGENGSSFLDFSLENCCSANWDSSERSRCREMIIERLKRGEMDLVIAMGTWAGQDLATDDHDVPVMVLSTSNPIKAGIIRTAANSGYPHVTARVDPTRYLRQLRMFHRIVGFKTLGVAFENTPDGRVYSAVEEINAVSGERGFKVNFCEITETDSNVAAADQSCLDCYNKLSNRADAIYVTALTCVDRRLPEIVEILETARVPSFSMMGSKLVRQGILLSISSDSGYAQLGKYNARKLGSILNGTKPSNLNQVFEDPLDIAVNKRTARRIKFEIPSSILRIASETYE